MCIVQPQGLQLIDGPDKPMGRSAIITSFTLSLTCPSQGSPPTRPGTGTGVGQLLPRLRAEGEHRVRDERAAQRRLRPRTAVRRRHAADQLGLPVAVRLVPERLDVVGEARSGCGRPLRAGRRRWAAARGYGEACEAEDGDDRGSRGGRRAKQRRGMRASGRAITPPRRNTLQSSVPTHSQLWLTRLKLS